MSAWCGDVAKDLNPFQFDADVFGLPHGEHARDGARQASLRNGGNNESVRAGTLTQHWGKPSVPNTLMAILGPSQHI